VSKNSCTRLASDVWVSHIAKNGKTISADCEYCHKQIETPALAPGGNDNR
jgi:hypothetical protein